MLDTITFFYIYVQQYVQKFLTAITNFERLYLVAGLEFLSLEQIVCVLSHPHDLLTNYFSILVRMPLNFFVRTIHQVIWPSACTLVMRRSPTTRGHAR